jgi:hypothetical protein
MVRPPPDQDDDRTTAAFDRGASTAGKADLSHACHRTACEFHLLGHHFRTEEVRVYLCRLKDRV